LNNKKEKEMNMAQQENAPRKNAEFTRGRPFAKGNPGRPRGSKNRTTAIAQALLADEETELVRKGIEVAKAGDVQMLKWSAGSELRFRASRALHHDPFVGKTV
jgi:hypothetical protein